MEGDFFKSKEIGRSVATLIKMDTCRDLLKGLYHLFSKLLWRVQRCEVIKNRWFFSFFSLFFSFFIFCCCFFCFFRFFLNIFIPNVSSRQAHSNSMLIKEIGPLLKDLELGRRQSIGFLLISLKISGISSIQ